MAAMLKNLTDEQKHIRLDEQEHIRLLWQLGCDLRSSIDGIKIDQRKMQAKIEAMQAMKGVRIKRKQSRSRCGLQARGRATPNEGKSTDDNSGNSTSIWWMPLRVP